MPANAKRPPSKFTNTSIDKLECDPGKRYTFFWDSVIRGLGVRVSEDGKTRTYVFLYRVHGSRQERQITIGRHRDPYLIEQARDRANELKVEMRSGVDPVLVTQQKAEAAAAAAVKTRAQSITLQEVLDDYLKTKKLRDATANDYRRHLFVNLADWVDEPVASITRDACAERCQDTFDRSPSQATQCFVYLRALLNHARELFEDDDGSSELFPVNPVKRMFKKHKPHKDDPRDTRVPLGKVRAVWQMLEQRGRLGRTVADRTAADWVRFIMLTGCRAGESGKLKWANVDLDARTFHLPSEDVKNGNGITFPMSTTMHALLNHRWAVSKVTSKRRRAERPLSEFVFASNSATGYMLQAQSTMVAVSEVAGEHLTLHDLRRTLTDVAAEVGVRPDRERMLLNHISGDVHARHYANSKLALVDDVERIAKWITTPTA